GSGRRRVARVVRRGAGDRRVPEAEERAARGRAARGAVPADGIVRGGRRVVHGRAGRARRFGGDVAVRVDRGRGGVHDVHQERRAAGRVPGRVGGVAGDG